MNNLDEVSWGFSLFKYVGFVSDLHAMHSNLHNLTIWAISDVSLIPVVVFPLFYDCSCTGILSILPPIFLSYLVDWSVWFSFCLLCLPLFHFVVVVLPCHMVYSLFVKLAWWRQSHSCCSFVMVNYWWLCPGLIDILVALWWWVRSASKMIILSMSHRVGSLLLWSLVGKWLVVHCSVLFVMTSGIYCPYWIYIQSV